MDINDAPSPGQQVANADLSSRTTTKGVLPVVVVLIVVTVGIIITIATFSKERKQLRDTLSRRFQNMVVAQVSAFKQELNTFSREFDAVRRFYRGSVQVDLSEFEMFTKPICANHPEISAMVWAPRVAGAERNQHETNARHECPDGYEIRQVDSQGRITRANNRDFYFPAYYIEPPDGNETICGLDFATIPKVLPAMQSAATSTKATITERLVWPNDRQENVTFIHIVPIYGNSVLHDSGEEQFEQIRGFVIGVIRVEELMTDPLRAFDLSEFRISLRDVSADASSLIYESASPTESSRSQNSPADMMATFLVGSPLRFEETISFGGREWRFEVEAQPAFYSVSGMYAPWYVLAAGFFITLLLSMLIHGLQAHAARVEKLVEIRTRELAGSEGRLRAITEGSPAFILMLDPDGGVIYSNCPLGENGEGKSHSLCITDLIDPEQQDSFSHSIRSVFERGETVEIELALDFTTGEIVQCLCSLSLLNLPDEPDHVLMIATDITDRKIAEQELKKAQGYISNIVDSMPSSLIGVDPDGTITQWNAETQRVTGVAAKNAIGHPLAEMMPRLASEMETIKEAMQSRQTLVNTKLTRKQEGETRYEDVTIYPLLADGIDGAVIRIDDITDRVRIEEMMIQTEKMLSVGGLAAGMAHEINNPLGGMMQAAQNIERRLSPDLPANARAAEECGTDLETIHAYLESREIFSFLGGIRESGKRAAGIVRNMLQFSRKSEAELVQTNLSEIIDRAVELAGQDYDLKKQYDFRRIEIVREYAQDMPAVPIIQTEIEQVLLNLLRNGAQAMSDNPDDRPARFMLKTSVDGSMARIEVEDNGPGISEAIRKRVFEPFFTTKEVGTGTGLGLSVSYMIITQNHGGEMSVESVPGIGTTFTILLPLRH